MPCQWPAEDVIEIQRLDVFDDMYTPHDTATIAFEDILNVARKRVDILLDMAERVRVTESRGTHPRIRLDVPFTEGGGWTEFVESVCTRGVRSYDRDFLDALACNEWTVLHFPAYLVDERFAYQKAMALEDQAWREGAARPEVWVYLYERDGSEHRVV